MIGLDDPDLSVIEKLTVRKRRATKFDFNQMELSSDTENSEQSIDPEQIQSANETSLEEYLSTHLARHYKNCKKLSGEEVMKWQREIIDEPLLKMDSSLDDIAIQIFKNLLSYMGDRLSSKKPSLHVIKHIKLTINAPEELKDEAYCQVIKQITNNLDEQKCKFGWNFFAILASCYPPSTELYYSLLNYLLKIIRENKKDDLVKRANYILIRLSRTFEQKRKLSPTDFEIKYIENMKPIIITVNFYSGANTSIPIESYTTIRELKVLIMRKLQFNISRIPYYAIYEICDKPDCIEKRYLDESTKVVDILTVWNKEKLDYEKKNIQIEFNFYLQIQLYYKYNKDDLDTVTMNYIQTNFDVLWGQYNLDENEICNLAAISLYINNNNNNSNEELYNILKDDLKSYIPLNKIKKYNDEILTKKIMDIYITLKYDNLLSAKNAYLDILSKNIVYEGYQFFCTFSKKLNSELSNSQHIKNPDHITDECIVIVKPNEVVITDKERNELLTLPFNTIASYAVNNEIFVIVSRKSDREYTKYYFENNQTKIFRILMDSYTAMLSGNGIGEIINNNEQISKMFDNFPLAKLKPGQTLRSLHSIILKK
jgi:hypothetical protein